MGVLLLFREMMVFILFILFFIFISFHFPFIFSSSYYLLTILSHNKTKAKEKDTTIFMTGVRYIPSENLEALRQSTPLFLRSFVNDLVVVGKVSLLSHHLRDQVYFDFFSFLFFSFLFFSFLFFSFLFFLLFFPFFLSFPFLPFLSSPLLLSPYFSLKKENQQQDTFSLGSYFLEAVGRGQKGAQKNGVFISNLSVSVELKVREFLQKASLVCFFISSFVPFFF